MKVLLAGSTGFIGTHAAEALMEAGHRPIPYGSQEEGIDAVVNCAGRLGGPGITREELERSNLHLPLRLVYNCNNCICFFNCCQGRVNRSTQ